MVAESTRKGQKRGQGRTAKQRRELALSLVRDATYSYEQEMSAGRSSVAAVHAWNAIATCLSARLEMPEWTREYLLDVAREIATLSRQAVPKKGEIDRAVATALKLRGGPKFNPFTAVTEEAHEFLIAFDVYKCQSDNHWNHQWGNMKNGPIEPTYDWNTIFHTVADRHHRKCEYGCKKKISSATVKRCWYKHALRVIPPHLIARSKSKKLADILR